MPFKKGKSGNPGGRPKADWTFLGLYKEELENLLTTDKGEKIEAKKAVAKRLVRMAVEGDINAIKELANRIEGMPRQATDLNMGGEVIINIDELIGLSKLTAKAKASNPNTSK